MDNFDFVLENIRFHSYEENTLLLVGWYQEDNPDGRYLEVCLDDQSLEILYDNKKGIPVRQKYLQYRANVSEEIRAIIQLPEHWQDAKELAVYCIHGEERILTKAFTTDWLRKYQKNVEYYVETNQYTDGKRVISGWAAGDGEVEIRLVHAKGQHISAEVERSYRRDVMAVFEELPENYQAGFRITAEIGKKEKVRLIFSCKDKKSVYTVPVYSSQKNGTQQNLVLKGIGYFQKYGLRAAVSRAKVKLLGEQNVDLYQEWRRKYEPTAKEIEQQRGIHFAYEPKFSIVIPLYNTKEKYLREMIESILSQTYTNWELCLADGSGRQTPLKAVLEEYAARDARISYTILEENKGISENTNEAIRMAAGDYVVFADHDDLVPPHALFECVRVLNEDASIDVIYSDEDKVDMNGKKYFEPHFKSDYNIDLLCSMNYICHLFVVKSSLIGQVGMLRSEYDGAQDHDFILRCTEQAHRIYHIPKILYHWRCHLDSTAENPQSKMYAFENGKKAVQAHYDRMHIPATVQHGQFYGMYRTVYEWKETPLISIIIPNKDHSEDLKTCIDSIEKLSTYRNYEFIIVENNSTEDATFAYYKELEKQEHIRVLYYKDSFNYSKINNFGVEQAKGEYLLLLNNDTELIAPDGIKDMLGVCMRSDVGIVGARLYYNDDTIQHAGVVLGFGGIAGHAFIGSSRFDNGYMSRIICAQDYSAVTAACLMTRKSVYEQVGGLSEEYQVAFNDIDYCMKVRRTGKLVVYQPAAELYHYESKSRGLEDTPEKVERFNSEVARFIENWGRELEAKDPYYNPNLTLDKADFSLKQ